MNNIEYVKNGDYLTPNLYFKQDEVKDIGKYGRIRLNYLKTNNTSLYNELLYSNKLNNHLSRLNNKCIKKFDEIINTLKENFNITESLKEKDNLEWTKQMNMAKKLAKEIILREYVFKK